ncbi:hypothetical protein [Massilia sp. S19_KUP03_FR1]|uniref:hypothetical protein n=1 Tax=Massilia sp. S19_KUP03_FR1 TaxID=3025503 RepID=UPI002FCDBEB6
MDRVKKCVSYIALASICSLHTLATATSRMGTAIVTESDGRPCFSIQSDNETKNGLPLHGIAVSENISSVAGRYPEEFWRFVADDPAPKNLILPSECVRYGVVPGDATERVHKQLAMFHVYSVSVVARHENSNMIAYRANFCMKPIKPGKIEIVIIPNNYRGSNDAHALCHRSH